MRNRRLLIARPVPPWARPGLAVLLAMTTGCSGMCGSQKSVAVSIAAGGIRQNVPIDATLELPASVVTPAAEVVKSIDEARGRYSDADFDPDARAVALGPGIAKNFAFVRDEIRYEAYSGVLRGAYGTLTSRGGNSLDRSLLLARLLTQHGVQVRFAAGDLPRDAALKLYAHIFDGFDAFPLDGAAPPHSFLERLLTRASRDYAVIKAALGPDHSGAAAKARERALSDITRHVWLQASIDGRWQDLDTSFGDAVPGKAYCPPTQTSEQIPPDWYQQVALRVVAERADGGVVTQSEALKLEIPAAELIDQTVFLTHVPAKSRGGGLGLGVSHSGAGPDDWTPVLVVGDAVHEGQPVAFGDAGGGLLDAFGGGDTSAFVAEWLEFEVVRPDGRREVTRRALADRANAQWRASREHDTSALRPLDRDQRGLLAPRGIHNLLFSAGQHDLSAYVRSIAWSASDGTPPADASPGLQLLPIALLNYAALVWSDHVIIPVVNDTASVRLYPDSPRIFIVSSIPTADGRALELYDLRRDHLLGLARDEVSEPIVADRKIWFAALEGALEHEAVARDAVLFGGNPAEVLSTSSKVGPSGVAVLRPNDVRKVPELTNDPDRAARLSESLERGNTIIVHRSTLLGGELAFWEIADNGDTRPVAGPDLNKSGMMVSYNPIPRPPPQGGIRYDIDRPGFKGGGSGTRTGKAGTEYLGVVIVAVDLIAAATLLQAVVRQKLESARIELETDQLIAAARKRQQAAGGGS
jgi:hypothetical protein